MSGMNSMYLLMVTNAAIETHPTVITVFHAFSSKLLLFMCCNLRTGKEESLSMNIILFIICDFLHTQYHVPTCNSPLVITIKLKIKVMLSL
jgi:hypothetical protein